MEAFLSLPKECRLRQHVSDDHWRQLCMVATTVYFLKYRVVYRDATTP